MSNNTFSPQQVRSALLGNREIALLDVREEADHAKGHPLFASSLPFSRLELDIPSRVPRKDCLIVLMDNGEGLAGKAELRLLRLGYSHVRLLGGGLAGWKDAGYELFQDVNSYSKAFGELVEARAHTPYLDADEVSRLIDENSNMVLLDARRFDEYNTMNIPTSISVPGAELIFGASMLAQDPQTLVIVNCAGRTRSIIGTQSLINAGVPNQVRALRNGTIGWLLAGLELTHSQTRQMPDIDPARLESAKQLARAVSYRAGVRHISVDELSDFLSDCSRTTYCFDVRAPQEFRRGHIQGFRSAPGGQLVQEIDSFAPVRNARLVLADDQAARADMTASWLAQMGWAAYVLVGGFDKTLELGPSTTEPPELPDVPLISVRELDASLGDDILIVDLATSAQHRTRHIPGARFAIRSKLTADVLEGHDKVIFTSPDGLLARFAYFDHSPTSAISVLDGGTDAWIAANLPVANGIENPLTDQGDVYRRPYEGLDSPRSAMQAYLDWEYGLVEQLERDGTHGFVVIGSGT